MTGQTRHDDLVVRTGATPEEVEHISTSQSGKIIAQAEKLFDVNLDLEILKPNLEHKPRGFFADQFENESNYLAHYHGTGPEILRQSGGHVDAFISGAGESTRFLDDMFYGRPKSRSRSQEREERYRAQACS